MASMFLVEMRLISKKTRAVAVVVERMMGLSVDDTQLVLVFCFEFGGFGEKGFVLS